MNLLKEKKEKEL